MKELFLVAGDKTVKNSGGHKAPFPSVPGTRLRRRRLLGAPTKNLRQFADNLFLLLLDPLRH